jgi:hypothetical protein
MTDMIAVDERIRTLERRLRTMQVALAFIVLAGAGLLMGALRPAQPEAADEIRTRRLVVVDDAGVPRVVIGQDPVDTQRRSRSAGITIYDTHGHERGGMSTFDDGSVVLALDAPVGVGAPMRDRAAMVVWPNGASYVMLLDNETKAVAKLHSDGQGGGGVQVFDWDDEEKVVRTKTLTYDGEDIDESPMGGG